MWRRSRVLEKKTYVAKNNEWYFLMLVSTSGISVFFYRIMDRLTCTFAVLRVLTWTSCGFGRRDH